MDEVEKIVNALRCDRGEESNCDMCEYHTNGGCYGRLLENDAADLIEKQSAEIDELREKLDEAKLGFIWHAMLLHVGDLIDENERLRNQVYNMTLYLLDAIKNLDRLDKIINCKGENRFTIAFNEDYDGMPGYNPTILEVRDGTND